MDVTVVSDLHGAQPVLEGGDLLILAGDYTASDTTAEWLRFRDWLRSLDYKKKIMIGGNHDMAIFAGHFYFGDEWLGATWLNDSGCEYEGFKFWGSPWTAFFEGMNRRCTAWMLPTEKALGEKWREIPEDTDVLITHSPPYSILDEACREDGCESVGSMSLLLRVGNIQPRLHAFGHVHEAYGRFVVGDTHFVNASIMNVDYKPVNKPVRLEL